MRTTPVVDEEFRALLPPLTPDQRAGLEASILAEGVLSALVVWEEGGLLLDGHNRFEIAQREGLPFPTREVKLPSREAAVEWIFKHQRDRRNLTPDQLALVMGRHYNRTKGTANGRPDPTKKDPIVGRTSDRLASEYGVSHAAIEANGKFAAGRDTRNLIAAIRNRVAVLSRELADKEEAEKFLRGDGEPWRESRALWFDAAGLASRTSEEIEEALTRITVCTVCHESPVRTDSRGRCDKCLPMGATA